MGYSARGDRSFFMRIVFYDCFNETVKSRTSKQAKAHFKFDFDSILDNPWRLCELSKCRIVDLIFYEKGHMFERKIQLSRCVTGTTNLIDYR